MHCRTGSLACTCMRLCRTGTCMLLLSRARVLGSARHESAAKAGQLTSAIVTALGHNALDSSAQGTHECQARARVLSMPACVRQTCMSGRYKCQACVCVRQVSVSHACIRHACIPAATRGHGMHAAPCHSTNLHSGSTQLAGALSQTAPLAVQLRAAWPPVHAVGESAPCS